MNGDLTILIEQKKEELRKGYRSPLLKYHVAARPLNVKLKEESNERRLS